jgi:hypothetical protein
MQMFYEREMRNEMTRLFVEFCTCLKEIGGHISKENAASVYILNR